MPEHAPGAASWVPPRSVRQRVDAPASGVSVNATALPALTSPGAALTVSAGATVSTVHDLVTDRSLPTASFATTSKTCGPCASPVRSTDGPQVVREALSTRQRSVAPVSLRPKTKRADVERTSPVTSVVKLIAGARVSTVHCRTARLWSMFPTASTPRT